MGLSRLERYIDIMKVLSEHDSTTTELKRNVVFDCSLLQKHLTSLLAMGLIRKTIDNGRIYAITNKGIRTVAYFDHRETVVIAVQSRVRRKA